MGLSVRKGRESVKDERREHRIWCHCLLLKSARNIELFSAYERFIYRTLRKGVKEMSVKAAIKEQIDKLRPGQMVASREVLHHGRRSNVDNAMSQLFADRFIFRVAQGVYIRGDEHTPRPSQEEIARYKAKIYCKQIAPIDAEFAKDLGVPVDFENKCLFATTGRTGTIWTIQGDIQFVGTSGRKIALGESKICNELRTIWCLGQKSIEHTMRHVIMRWNELCWDEANSRMKELPQWLAEHTLKLPRAGPNQWVLN